MISIGYITNARSGGGVGNRAQEIADRLRMMDEFDLVPFMLNGELAKIFRYEEEIVGIKKWPGILRSKSINWLRLGNKLPGYLRKSGSKIDIYHLTNQSLSFLAGRLSPAVITVHDLIELTDPQQNLSAVINRQLYRNISKAKKIIAVSNHTKDVIRTRLNIAEERIDVIYNGVSSTIHPIEGFQETIAYQELRRRLRLGSNSGPIVLYVGSEHPRKNLPSALKAFVQVHKNHPQAIFLKVGEPGIATGRQEFLNMVDLLKIRSNVRILAKVSREELNEIYNLADVLIHPSWLEGFGLPPLEAMAAGTPVVVSNTTSLPEVVGEAGLLNNPDDIDGFAISLLKIIEQPEVSNELIAAGFKQAAKFSWASAAQAEAAVYNKLL